jgi:integrase
LTDYRINQKKSLTRAEKSVDHLRETFEDMKVTDITTDRIKAYIEDRMAWKCGQCEEAIPEDGVQDVEGFECPHCGSEDALKRGAANATINRELAALKRMLNLGAQQTPPKVDRVPHIPMLKENNTRKGFFEHGEFLALREALPSYLRGFVTFAYKTGWRVSEIVGLTWAQVDRHQGIVRLEVGETKNSEGRTIYLDEELKQILHEQWETRVHAKTFIPYVFPGKEGKDRIKDFRCAWNKACEGAGIGKRLFHDYRRTAVRNMVRSGVPERVAMTISGHKTRSVFERYNIVSEEDLKIAAQKQQDYLKTQAGTISGTVSKVGVIGRIEGRG